MQEKLLGIINMDLDATGQLLIIYCVVLYIRHLSNTWKKWKYNEAVHDLFTDFKKAYDSIRREGIVQYSN